MKVEASRRRAVVLISDVIRLIIVVAIDAMGC
jgi:hypothetical protein